MTESEENFSEVKIFFRKVLFLCDTPGKRLPCLHEQAFAGQGTATGFAWSCPQYRSG